MNNSVTYFFGVSNEFSNQPGAREISRRSLVLMVGGSVDLLAEPHNTLYFLFLEVTDANQRRGALLECDLTVAIQFK
jgi:hypothetical protein